MQRVESVARAFAAKAGDRDEAPPAPPVDVFANTLDSAKISLTLNLSLSLYFFPATRRTNARSHTLERPRARDVKETTLTHPLSCRAPLQRRCPTHRVRSCRRSSLVRSLTVPGRGSQKSQPPGRSFPLAGSSRYERRTMTHTHARARTSPRRRGVVDAIVGARPRRDPPRR